MNQATTFVWFYCRGRENRRVIILKIELRNAPQSDGVEVQLKADR
jgi:hypothetical protein